jgi:predicted amidophosphoribosyltransferase
MRWLDIRELLLIRLNSLVSLLSNAGCRRCQYRLPESAVYCGSCQSALGLDEPYWDEAHPIHAVSTRTAEMRGWLNQYKFSRRGHRYAEALSDCLIGYAPEQLAFLLDSCQPGDVWVTTIPKHKGSTSRHPAPIVKRFARKLGFRYRGNLLAWTRETGQQHRLSSRNQRLHNMHGSLAADERQWSRHLKPGCAGPKMLIIVDDLTTTGATLQEALRAIRSGPDSSIRAVALAISHVPHHATQSMMEIVENSPPCPTSTPVPAC